MAGDRGDAGPGRGRPLGQRQGRERRDHGHRLRGEAARVAPAVPLEGEGLGQARPALGLEHTGILVDGDARPLGLEGRVDRLRQAARGRGADGSRGPRAEGPRAVPAAARLSPHDVPGRQARPPGRRLLDLAGDPRPAPQRPARQRRLLQSRLDRLHPARLLPGLRRDRPRPARGQRPRGHPGRRLVQRLRGLRQEARPLRQAPAAPGPAPHRVTPTAAREDIATGPDWKATARPDPEADFLMGETLRRAARPCTAGTSPGFDDAELGARRRRRRARRRWSRPIPARPCGRSPSSRPESIKEPKPGVYVLDMGQNFAGVPRLKVTGEPGQKITLRFAERLNPDGTIYTTNLREARCIDTYICTGKGEETWSPRFTFHGFQYVEITGLKSPPTRGDRHRHRPLQRHARRRPVQVLRPDAQPAPQQHRTGPSGPTSSTSPPTAPSATSGWAGPATPRSTSARRRSTATSRPSSPSGWSTWSTASGPTASSPWSRR